MMGGGGVGKRGTALDGHGRDQAGAGQGTIAGREGMPRCSGSLEAVMSCIPV